MSDFLHNLCHVGKTLSITATITDTKKAQKMLGTLYKQDSEVGLSVISWGLFNETEALQNRENIRNR